LVSARARAGSAWSSPVLFRGLLGDLLVLPCFARWAAGFSVGSPAAASVGSCSTPDGLKAFLGDAQCARAVVIATPHRNGAPGSDFFDQPLGQELGDDLLGGTAGQIWWRFKGAVVAL
jgi:hypothetical protein